jgi:hypothetical protein
MDEPRSYTTHMTQELMELNLGKTTARMGPKLSLKNAFECNFLVFVKVYFSLEQGQLCDLCDYDSNITHGIKIRGPEVLK